MEFKGAWTEYISYRRERRLSRLTPRTINRQLRQLEAWGHDAAIQSIETTITKGWQGLFEPKPDPQTQKRKLTDADHAAGF